VPAFSPATYVPGDAWSTMEFATRAITAPRLRVTGATVAGTTPASYFEFRKPDVGDSQEVEVSVIGGSSTVVLERSFDDGTTWQIVKTYTNGGEDTYRYAYPVMLRLRVVSGSGLTLSLRQQVQ